MNISTNLRKGETAQGEQLIPIRLKHAFPVGLTVTGEFTRCTLLSSTRISRAFKHKAWTSSSRRYSHRVRRSICSSRHAFPPLINAAMFIDKGGKPCRLLGDIVPLGITASTMAALMMDMFSCGVLNKRKRFPWRWQWQSGQWRSRNECFQLWVQLFSRRSRVLRSPRQTSLDGGAKKSLRCDNIAVVVDAVRAKQERGSPTVGALWKTLEWPTGRLPPPVVSLFKPYNWSRPFSSGNFQTTKKKTTWTNRGGGSNDDPFGFKEGAPLKKRIRNSRVERYFQKSFDSFRSDWLWRIPFYMCLEFELRGLQSYAVWILLHKLLTVSVNYYVPAHLVLLPL